MTLNQQLALMPVAIPDSIVDFLEDFNYATSLQTDSTRNAFDQEYLKTAEETVKAELEAMKAAMGKIQQVKVEQAGRETPGGFLLKLTFEKGSRGIGVLTKLKERTILRLLLTEGDYDEAALKEILRNPK